MRGVFRQFLLRFLTLLFSLGASAFGDEVPQYLFLVDLSPQMAQRQIATAQRGNHTERRRVIEWVTPYQAFRTYVASVLP